MPLRTPLYEWHLAKGGRMVPFGGWDMPVQYSTIVEEHQAVRTAAGLFDVSHMGRVFFDGPQAPDLIQLVWTNDAADLQLGQARYGLVCNEQGGILDDVLVYRLPGRWLMVVNASNRDKILAWLQRQRGGFDAVVTDATAAVAMVALQGPQAVRLGADTLAQLGWQPAAGDGSAIEQLRYYHALPLQSAAPGSDLLLVSRTGYTGEDGLEIMAPSAQMRDGFVPALFEQAAKDGVNLKPCGLGARDTLRFEAAMPLYGHELNEDIDPLEAGLGWAVKLGKKDFVGSEALRRRAAEPARRKRVGLELVGKRIAREGAAVLADGKPVGQVTSGTFAPTLQKALAMAYVDVAQAAVGAGCQVDVRGKPEAARVVPLPFYKRPRT
jgi:aminomethyltransferase